MGDRAEPRQVPEVPNGSIGRTVTTVIAFTANVTDHRILFPLARLASPTRWTDEKEFLSVDETGICLAVDYTCTE